jgi:hypothetical protein
LGNDLLQGKVGVNLVCVLLGIGARRRRDPHETYSPKPSC